MRENGAAEVLLIEHNVIDVELILDAFRHDNLADNIYVAKDGSDGLDFLFCRGAHSDRSTSEQPELILLDLRMPGMDGIEVLRQIKTDARTLMIPVVVFTTSRHDLDLVACYQLGVNSVIAKPADLGQYREAVRQLASYWLLLNQAPPSAVDGR
jgi:CheY-like chemotaxis protein